MLLAYVQYGSATRKDTSLISLQRCQIFFYSAIVDAQELVGAGCHVNQIGFALGSFLVHETVYRVILGLCFQQAVHNQE